MKKTILYIVLILISNFSFAGSYDSDLVAKVLANLGLEKKDCYERFIVSKNIPNSTNESIVVIPKISELNDIERYIILDSYLVIANSISGEIISSYFEEKAWSSDAVRMENIEVKYQPYQISKDTETIGILIDYDVWSRASPYSSKELSLFVRNGEKLIQVLKDYALYRLNGETDGTNNGEFVKHKKIIETNTNTESGFFDLIVTDSIIKTQSSEGVEKIIEESKRIETLKYFNGKYKNVL
jgi:hypothetical protein